MTSEEVIEEMMSQTASYIVNMKAVIDHINTVKKPEDRLGLAAELSFCLNGMLLSIKGWGSWINNIQTLSTLTIEDLNKIYLLVKEISLQFLKIDIDITSKKLIETREKVEKDPKLKKKDKNEKNYVS